MMTSMLVPQYGGQPRREAACAAACYQAPVGGENHAGNLTAAVHVPASPFPPRQGVFWNTGPSF